MNTLTTNPMIAAETELAVLTTPDRSRIRLHSMDLEEELVPAVLTWKNIQVRSKMGKVLLTGDGQINGGLWAILGPSGSGKTTLLNALACRLDANFTVSGDVRLNGRTYSNSELKQMGGYVMQDDVLNAYLTVYETLKYIAMLRLPDLSPSEIDDKVTFVLKELGLAHCRDTVVGNAMRKGISGGERKRLCVAQELLVSPQLLFLDEPTSGLDSTTALDLVTKLRHLSRTVCTVVCSIHQPQTKIFHLFDCLVLVRSGLVVYHGTTRRALQQFESVGLPVPPMTNPADHLMEALSPAGKSTTLMSDHDLQKCISKLENFDVDLNLGSDKPWIVTRGHVPWLRQFLILCQRNFREQVRKRGILLTNIFQTIAIAILIGTVFLNIGHNQRSINRRQAALFFCCINQGIFGSQSVINSFPSERSLSLRERAAGTYMVSAYFLAKSLIDALAQLITPILFSCVVYFLIGFETDPHKFFVFMAFMILCNLSSTSAALMVSAICRTTDLSMIVLPMMLEVSRLFGGFFLAPTFLPEYFSWLDALSFYKYSYVGVSLNELDHLEYYCEPTELRAGVCPTTKGDQTIEALGLDYITVGGCAGALVGFILFTRMVAFFAVKYLKH